MSKKLKNIQMYEDFANEGLGDKKPTEVKYRKDAPQRKPETRAKREKELEGKMDDYFQMTSKIEEITAKYEKLLAEELGDMKSEHQLLGENVKVMVKKLKIQNAKSNGVIASYRKAYTSKSISYKPLFDEALTKVNASVRNILEELIEQHTKLKEVPEAIYLKRESSVWDTIKKSFKEFIGWFSDSMKKVKGNLSEWEEDTDRLEKQWETYFKARGY